MSSSTPSSLPSPLVTWLSYSSPLRVCLGVKLFREGGGKEEWRCYFMKEFYLSQKLFFLV